MCQEPARRRKQAVRFTWALIALCGVSNGAGLAAAGQSGAGQTPWAEILDGSRFELCREYHRGLEEGQARRNYCGVALPAGNGDFRLPKWEAMEPAAHMDLVRDIFYWANASLNRLWDHKYYLEHQAGQRDIVPDMLARLWEPARSEIEALVAEGRIKLERARLDMNFDGKAEPVYRMTPILLNPSFGRAGKPEFVKHRIRAPDNYCKPQGLPGDDESFVYYMSPDDSLPAHKQLRQSASAADLRYFYWRGRVYSLRQGSIQEPVPHGDPGWYFLRQVCTIRLNHE